MSLPLGYAIDHEDHDWLANAAGVIPFSSDDAPVPEEIDPRGVIARENQGQVGSCGGHAGCHGAAGLNWFGTAGDSVQRFSRMFLYLMAQKCCGLFGQDKGTSITGLVQAMQKYGCCLEADFPYPGRYVTQIPQRAIQNAASHKIAEHVQFRNYDETFHWLSRKWGTVMLGIPWTEGWAQCNGVATRSNVMSGRTLGGHAQAWLGYSRRKDKSGRNYLIQYNSHGDQWGVKGTCEIHPDLVQYYIEDRGSEVIGIRALTAVNADRLSLNIGGGR